VARDPDEWQRAAVVLVVGLLPLAIVIARGDDPALRWALLLVAVGAVVALALLAAGRRRP
jgi:hypothetical protein